MNSVAQLGILAIAGVLLLGGEALAYGVTIKSSQSTTVESTLRTYELNVLKQVADCWKDNGVPAQSQFELVINQDGKVVDATFVTNIPYEPLRTAAISRVKSLTFNKVPCVQGESTLTLSFSGDELESPPYSRSSVVINSEGGAVINGGMSVGGTRGGAERKRQK